MFKKKIVRMTQEEFDTMVSIYNTNMEARKDADKRVSEYCSMMYEYHNQLLEAQRENGTLIRENTNLKMLFDDKADTKVIKFNGKLYAIASANLYKDGAEETLDISCFCVGEVN